MEKTSSRYDIGRKISATPGTSRRPPESTTDDEQKTRRHLATKKSQHPQQIRDEAPKSKYPILFALLTRRLDRQFHSERPAETNFVVSSAQKRGTIETQLYKFEKMHRENHLTMPILQPDIFFDPFPSKMTDTIQEWDDLSKLDIRDHTWYKRTYFIIPFLTYIPPADPDQKVTYRRNLMSPPAMKYLTNILKKNTRTTTLWLQIANPWYRLSTQLAAPLPISRRDIEFRLGFRWRNVFLVNKWFTTGLRMTTTDEIHLIQTAAAPLFYYRAQRPDLIPTTDVRQFHLPGNFLGQVLFPNTVYMVPEKAAYCLIAYEDCIFALDRCSRRFIQMLQEGKNVKIQEL